jgi:hypothetical protein
MTRKNPIIHRTPFYAGRWEIREYADGMIDAAATRGIALSPGFVTWDEAVSWVCDQETAHTNEAKLTTINAGYDAGLSLPAIIRSVGTDEATLLLVSRSLGVAMSTLRREVAWIEEQAI